MRPSRGGHVHATEGRYHALAKERTMLLQCKSLEPPMSQLGHERPTLLPRRHRYDSNTLESRHYFLVGLGHMLVVLSNRGVRLCQTTSFQQLPVARPGIRASSS